MNRKEYTLPSGKKAVFEYDVTETGKVTLECMDMLMAMIADRPQGEWLLDGRCSECLASPLTTHKNYCPNCGAKMKGQRNE